MIIRDYKKTDETGWIRCRVLSFLETAYFDNVLKEKEVYDNPSIELVAELDGEIIGLLDVEFEHEKGTVCSRGTGLGGMIWHIAVHPDYRRRKIGEALLKEAEERARKFKLNRFEAWTRDDKWVNRWYEKMDFQRVTSYYHVYFEEEQIKDKIHSKIEDLNIVSSFAHYTGNNIEALKVNNTRVHECICFEKIL